MGWRQVSSGKARELLEKKRLTESNRVIDLEAAEDSVNITGMSKSIPSHHNLERF